MKLSQIRTRRSQAYRREMVPYLRYVLSSGLLTFTALLFIAGIHFYASLLRDLPENFPYRWVATVVLLPFIFFNPIRTYLKQADIIYVLPAETRMDRYIFQAIKASYIIQAILLLIAWFGLWPLYRTATAASGIEFVYVLAVLLVIKAASLFSHWLELQLKEKSLRQLYVIIRLVISTLLLYVLFTFSLLPAIAFISLVWLTYMLSLKIPNRYTIHWEALIHIEKQHRSKIYMFLSWFVDVPEYDNRVHTRPLLKHLLKLVPLKWTANNTYRFLYIRTWLRSDLFGIVIRLLLLSIVLITIIRQPYVNAAVYLFFLYIIGVQLSAISQYHRFSLWQQVYPLPAGSRIKAVQTIIFILQGLAFLFLSVLMFVLFEELWFAGIVIGVGLILYLWQQVSVHRGLKRHELL